MNEAETIDAYILPALKAAGWGAEGCRIRREAPIAPGRIEGHGRHGKVLKYHNSLSDVVADLGGHPEEIHKAFADFQKYLYQQTVAA